MLSDDKSSNSSETSNVQGLSSTPAGDEEPRKISRQFWQAWVSRDRASVEKLVTKNSLQSLPPERAKTASQANIDVGEATVQGKTATCAAKIIDRNGREMDVTTYLAKEGNAWKVAYTETMGTMYGGRAPGLSRALGESFQKDLENKAAEKK